MSLGEISRLTKLCERYEKELQQVRESLAEYSTTLKLLNDGKMTNIHPSDTARWKKQANAIGALVVANHDRLDSPGWDFYVTSESTNIVFTCYSPVKVVTKKELYDLVEGFLPDGFHFKTLMGSKGCGFSYIRDTTDLSEIYRFTCG